MMIAEKGTMGVGSSRMSGINNVALWMGEQASPYVPFVNIAPIVAGTNGISPIFQTTVGVTGGIGLDLKNWVKTIGEDGKVWSTMTATRSCRKNTRSPPARCSPSTPKPKNS